MFLQCSSLCVLIHPKRHFWEQETARVLHLSPLVLLYFSLFLSLSSKTAPSRVSFSSLDAIPSCLYSAKMTTQVHLKWLFLEILLAALEQRRQEEEEREALSCFFWVLLQEGERERDKRGGGYPRSQLQNRHNDGDRERERRRICGGRKESAPVIKAEKEKPHCWLGGRNNWKEMWRCASFLLEIKSSLWLVSLRYFTTCPGKDR